MKAHSRSCLFHRSLKPFAVLSFWSKSIPSFQRRRLVILNAVTSNLLWCMYLLQDEFSELIRCSRMQQNIKSKWWIPPVLPSEKPMVFVIPSLKDSFYLSSVQGSPRANLQKSWQAHTVHFLLLYHSGPFSDQINIFREDIRHHKWSQGRPVSSFAAMNKNTLSYFKLLWKKNALKLQQTMNGTKASLHLPWSSSATI